MSLYKYFKFAKTAMNISLVVAAGVFLWPGALAAVTSFSLFGFSIAALVGHSMLLQTGAVAGATFFGLHALELSLNAIGGFFSMLKYCFSSSNSHNKNQQVPVKVVYVNQQQQLHDSLIQTGGYTEPYQATSVPFFSQAKQTHPNETEYQSLYPNLQNRR